MDEKPFSLLKKSWPLLVLLPVLAAMIYFLPDLIKVRQIQTGVVSRISSSCGCELKMESMRWHWTPLPHLTLKKVQIGHPAFSAEIPRIVLSPQWSALLKHKAGIGMIELDRPRLTMMQFPLTGKEEEIVLPKATIVIKDGRLTMDSSPLPGIKDGSLNCTDIDGRLWLNSDSLELDLELSPDFARNIRVNGKFYLHDLIYDFSIAGNDVRLTGLLAEKDDDVFVPLDSTVNFSIQAVGEGKDNFDISVNGEFPDLAVKRRGETVRFDLAGGSLRFGRNGGNMSIALLDVQANEPELTLNGSIERYLDYDSGQPFWHLDLTAEETDLTTVGHDIMTIFADNTVARTVCNIVREAQVNEAHYVFDGPVSDFNYLDKMLIEVDIDTSTIYIPAPDLLLTRASGPIVIKGGKLTGSGLSARLGNSHGTNGSVVVGISDDLNDFYLDLDIDAEVSELPAALHHLIDLPAFRSEITKFHGQGRALGHLTMGDTLDDFTVRVAVTDMGRATVDYDRLPWRIAPTGGRLDITGRTASWSNFSAGVGPHFITYANGSAVWEGETELSITSLDADVEPGSFFAELLKYPVLNREITRAVTSLAPLTAGNQAIHLSSAELHGPFFSPQSWEYQFSALINDVKVDSPLLDDEFIIKKGQVSMNQDWGVFEECDTVFLGAALNLSGRLRHSYWADWGGRLTFNVILGEKQREWLLARNLAPYGFLPEAPCRLEDFTLSWGPEEVTLNGALVAGDNSWPRADLYVQRKNDELVQCNLRISEEEKSGELKISRLAPDQGYAVSWMGEAEAGALNGIFATPFLGGRLNGTFAVKLKDYQPYDFRGVGRLEDFGILWSKLRDPLEVKRLFVHGSDSDILVDDLDLNLRGESLSGSGKITAMPGLLNLDLDFSSPLFSRTAIDSLLTVFKNNTDELPFTVTGRVNFDFGVFLLAEERQDAPQSARFILSPLQGGLTLHEDGKKSFAIDSAELCGLDVEGRLEWHDGNGERRLIMKSNKDHHDRFQELLPCLNVSHSSLEGQFEFACSLQGTEKEWTGGEFTLTSQKGNLRRMVLLSNIFRVINFTDLLRDYGESGFPYSLIDVKGHIESDNIVLDKAHINGRGLDMLGEGRVNIPTMISDMTIYVVPLKTIDSVLNAVPVVGRAVGGRKGHIVTIPVSISGDIREPEVNVMSVKAIGLSTLKWIGDTLLLPYDLLIRPFADDEEVNSGDDGRPPE